jgi:hypothetical protein
MKVLMKRFFLVVLFICLLVQFSEAQIWKLKKFEIIGGLGTSQFFGDIGGFSRNKNFIGLRDISVLKTRFDVNANLRWRITQNLSTRLSLTYGLFHASDQGGSNAERGFAVDISVAEPALLLEYYFVKNKSESSYIFTKGRSDSGGGLLKSLDFYAFSGFGGLYYSVSANQNLKSRGIDPGGFTAVVPVGLGTTLVYSPNINFGVEFSGRYSFSDNLDGYTSQYSNSNDVYYFLNFTFTYKLKTAANGLPSFR